MSATLHKTASQLPTDSTLCAAALGGDRLAFRQIVERYQSLICSITLSALGDVGRSEDVAQETFVVAWNRMADLRDPANLKGWLCGIARRLASNVRRRLATDVAAQAAAFDAAGPIQANSPAPVEQAIQREESAVLWSVLSAMPQSYREPLVLYYRGQQSVAEVAAQLDLTEDTVKQRLSRGRKLLKAEVAAYIEKTFRASRPGTAFAAAVLAALPAAAPSAMATGLSVAAKSAGAKLAATSPAIAGAILGPLLGLIGAALGIMAAITGARSPRERRFMIQFVVAVVALVAALVASQTICLAFLPDAYRTVAFQLTLWGVYAVLLTLVVLWAKRRTEQIRIQEHGFISPSNTLTKLQEVPLRSFTWSLAGTMYGAVCWIAVAGVPAGDWLAPAAAFAVVGVVWQQIKRWLHASDTLKRRVLALLTGVLAAGAVDIIVSSLRWSAWQAAPGHVAQRVPLWLVNVIIVAVCMGVIIHLLVWYRSADRHSD